MKSKRIAVKLVLLMLVLSLVFTGIQPFKSYASELDRETFFKRVSEQIDFIEKNYYIELSESDLLEAMLKGLYGALDRWSGSFTKAEVQSIKDSLDDSFIGVGIVIEKINNYIIVNRVISGSPAEKAGIKKSDTIHVVDGLNVNTLSVDQVSSLIRGPENTTVELKIKKAGEGELINVSIVRESILVKSASHSEVDGVDVITISSFDEQTYDQFLDILKTEEFEHGIIIDLRDNGGGYLHTATNIADELLQRGVTIATAEYRTQSKQVYKSQKVGITDKLVVLINENSASASELFTGALQDNYRARIIGENSYGKGVIQQIYSLPHNQFIKLTTGEYITPSGRRLHGIGIIPEIRIATEHELLKISRNFRPLISDSEFKQGAEDPEIYGIKQRINYCKPESNLELNEVYDKKTESAVNSIKKSIDLYQDGKIDASFKKVLDVLVKQRAGDITRELQMTRAVKELKN